MFFQSIEPLVLIATFKKISRRQSESSKSFSCYVRLEILSSDSLESSKAAQSNLTHPAVFRTKVIWCLVAGQEFCALYHHCKMRFLVQVSAKKTEEKAAVFFSREQSGIVWVEREELELTDRFELPVWYLILSIRIRYVDQQREGGFSIILLLLFFFFFFLTERCSLCGSEGLEAGLGWWQALDQQSYPLVGPQSPQGWGLVQAPLGPGLHLCRTVRWWGSASRVQVKNQ